jgi:prophage regulatory protein
MQAQIYRFPKVEAVTGLSRSTILRLEKSGKFPRRVKLGARAVGFASADIHSWVASRGLV